VLARNGGWNDEQRSLALDLMGVSAEIRAMDSPLDAPDGIDTAEYLRELVESEMEVLAARQEESLDAIDEDLREATSLGLIAVDDPTLVLLRRYETASFRRQRWALDMLHKGRQRAEPAPTITNDYRERPRQAPYVWPTAEPVPNGDTPAPRPDPGSPTPEPDRTDLRGDQGHPAGPAQSVAAAVLRPERSQNGGPGHFAERSHLAGRLRRLARSLGARAAVVRPAKPGFRPGRRLSRPVMTPVRPTCGELLRLVVVPAA
jgi:hypothetical protein